MDPTLIVAAIQGVSATVKEGIAHERYMMEQMSPEQRQAYADAWADPKIWWQALCTKLGNLIHAPEPPQ